MFPSDPDSHLADLSFDLTAVTQRLAGEVPVRVQDGIGDLVRSMNCYYSNLIEGHNTRPRDIESALEDNYSSDRQRRTLQLEARAHIEVQRLIDSGQGPQENPASPCYIKWVHKEFCSRLPEDLLVVENPDTGQQERVVPGHYRKCGVSVGRHVPIDHSEIEQYLSRYAEAYDITKIPRSRYLIAIAAAHHRLVWIHPFLDGNGRVARLISHAMFQRCGIGSSLWSVSRGFARDVDTYKAALAGADAPRKGDLDGRGSLSDKGLYDFVHFFLKTSIDQVKFMNTLLEPSELLRRITLFVNDESDAGRLPNGTLQLLKEAYLTGEVGRGDVPRLTGYKERRARQILNDLMKKGLLVSQGARKPVRLGFPISVVERWLPGLYPV